MENETPKVDKRRKFKCRVHGLGNYAQMKEFVVRIQTVHGSGPAGGKFPCGEEIKLTHDQINHLRTLRYQDYELKTDPRSIDQRTGRSQKIQVPIMRQRYSVEVLE